MPDAPDDPAPAVLVVEDEALIAMAIDDALAGAGYRPAKSLDGTSVQADVAAAAVVDLRLARNLDGRDVIRRLREQRPALPVAVVTGFVPCAPEADLRGLGGPTVRLHKPFDFADLTGGVEAMLRAAPDGPVPRRRAGDAMVKASLPMAELADGD